MIPDLGADDIHDLLSQVGYNFFMVRVFVESRRGNDLSRVSFVIAPFYRLAESEDDVGSCAVGEVRRGGGDGSGHAEKIDPNATVFFIGILVEDEGGFAFISETADEGAHGAFAWNDGHSGFFAERIQEFVDSIVFGDGGYAGYIDSEERAFKAY